MQFIRINLHAHYLTQQHQESLIRAISPVNKQPSDIGLPSTSNDQILNDDAEGLSVEERSNQSTLIATNANQHRMGIDERTDRTPSAWDDGTFTWRIQNVREKMSK